MTPERADRLVRDLTNAYRRALRAGSREKAEAYRYAAWMARQAASDGAS